jgi:cell wall-associated NlpC family hydrolase
MPLQQARHSSIFANIAPKKKLSPFRFFALCFALSSLQFIQPATAFCDLPSETVVKQQQTVITSEQPKQTFGHMGTFFYDVTHYFGTRYRFGGQTPAGFDCSGFVRFMYDKAFNMHLPRSSREMSAIGNKVKKDELQPGDLVFFHTKGQHINHVGIFIGNDTFIHSSLSKGITEDRLQQNYFEKRFAGAVRLLNLSTEKFSFPSAQPETTMDNTEPS